MSQQEEMKNLTLLGSNETPYIFEYSPQVLESFDNRHADNDYFIKFNCPEFTSLCP
ncbi:MAG: NADPH-dependent 7-cyano-7-deazaguanine reductase QueF, partial [Streptococcus sp.]|nr:NADPH-dependent 7-cyano-7-deazaguanine reductase QueF [Streptococcus sp.]